LDICKRFEQKEYEIAVKGENEAVDEVQVFGHGSGFDFTFDSFLLLEIFSTYFEHSEKRRGAYNLELVSQMRLKKRNLF